MFSKEHNLQQRLSHSSALRSRAILSSRIMRCRRRKNATDDAYLNLMIELRRFLMSFSYYVHLMFVQPKPSDCEQAFSSREQRIQSTCFTHADLERPKKHSDEHHEAPSAHLFSQSIAVQYHSFNFPSVPFTATSRSVSMRSLSVR